MDSCLILCNVQINNFSTASNIELNSWVLNHFKCYQLQPTLIIYIILESFQDEFPRGGYTKFGKLDLHIREAFKKTFMARGIYMGKHINHINKRLANFVINEQILI